MPKDIDSVLLFAEKNSKIKSSTLKAYKYTLARLCRSANKKRRLTGQESLLEILTEYRENYLNNVVPPGQRESSSSAVSFWFKMIKRMRESESELRKRTNRIETGNGTVSYPENDLPVSLLKKNSSLNAESIRKATDVQPNKGDLAKKPIKEQATDPLHVPDEGEIDRKPRKRVTVDTSALSPYLKEIWRLISDSKDPTRILSDEAGWAETTIKSMFKELKSMVYVLTSEVSTTAEPGGLGLKMDEINVFDLINPSYVKRYVEFRVAGIGSLTRTPLMYLRVILALVKPRHGWIRKNINWVFEMHGDKLDSSVELSKREKRYVEDIENKNTISKIWKSFANQPYDYEKSQREIKIGARILSLCDQIYEEISEIYRSIENKLEGTLSRDPFIPIGSLVKMKKPLKMVALALTK